MLAAATAPRLSYPIPYPLHCAPQLPAPTAHPSQGSFRLESCPRYRLVEEHWEWAEEFSARRAYLNQAARLTSQHGLQHTLGEYSRQQAPLEPTLLA